MVERGGVSLEDLRGRDPTAAEDFVRRSQGVLFRHALNAASSLNSPRHDAEDAVQEAFARFFERINLSGSMEQGNLVGYLLISVGNFFRDRYKSSHFKKAIVSDNIPESSTETIEEIFRSREEYKELREKVDELDPVQRDVVYLTAEGLSQKEIGQKINRSETAVKSMLFRARRRLKIALG